MIPKPVQMDLEKNHMNLFAVDMNLLINYIFRIVIHLNPESVDIDK